MAPIFRSPPHVSLLSWFPFSCFGFSLFLSRNSPRFEDKTHNAFLHPQCNALCLARVFNCVFPNMIVRKFVLKFHEYTMVESIVYVTADYEAQLARSGYIHRFSYGRRILRDDGDPNGCFLMYSSAKYPTPFSS